MKLEHLELENFASYYGRHPIDLDVSANKPLVIVIGRTGFGKTTLFDAINWVLYGQEYEADLKKTRKRNILDFVNESVVSETARNGQLVSMSVTLRFSHNLTRYIKSVNITIAVKKNKGKIELTEKFRQDKFEEFTPKGDMKAVHHQKLFLDEILPNNVKSYFLFDGDRIYNLANPGNSHEVKDAIYRVVDLEIIKKAEEHLEELSTEYGRKAKKEAKGPLLEAQENYNAAIEKEAELVEEGKIFKQEIKSLETKIQQIDDKLAELPESERLQAEKNRLQKEIATKEQETLSIKQGLRSEFTIASYQWVLPQIKDLTKLIDSKRKKGDIPKHVSETLIKDIIEIGKCICGSSVEENSALFKTLKDRLEADRDKSEKEHEILRLLFDLQTVQDNIAKSKETINKGDDSLVDLVEEIRSLKLDFQEVENELDKLPQEDVATLRQNLKIFRKEKEDLILKDGQNKGFLENIQKDIKELEKQLKELNKQQDVAALLQERSLVARNASKELATLYDEFAEESRKQVEQLTIEEFKKFVFSSSAYQVALSKEYELQVIDSNGNRALQRMSMGQSQCLSLAFITAISRVSQKNPPLVIDMPFSRLDRETHASISKRLPKLSEQTILFLIPEVEWNEDTQNILSSKAAHIYELNFNEKSRRTSIEKINR